MHKPEINPEVKKAALAFFKLQITKGLGLSDEDLTMSAKDGQGKEQKFKIFEPVFDDAKYAGIRINYIQLATGLQAMVKPRGNKWPVPFSRVRLLNPFKVRDERGEEDLQRYTQKAGTGTMPFFMPELVEDFRKKKTIDILVITEGEKKAAAAVKAGIKCIGIPSIQGFYDGETRGRMHPDIYDFIRECKVKHLIYLTDADTLAINYRPGKDLAKRQSNFAQAVINFRYNCQTLMDREGHDLKHVYFMHLNTGLNETSKGLDDLLAAKPGEHAEIRKMLTKERHLAGKFFTGIVLGDGFDRAIKQYFGLNSAEAFHGKYEAYIGKREFHFKGRIYEHNGEKVQYLQHKDTAKFMRIGPDWYKLINNRNKYGEIEEEIIPWKITEITRDYKRFPGFVEDIPKYDGFCNVPEYFEGYKRVHNMEDTILYNLCAPLQHAPNEGGLDNTYKFLKHIFQGDGTMEEGGDILGDPFTVAMDWLTIFFNHPMQMLPVIILVSKEKETGKSTFLKWISAILGSNACILNNEQFKMRFNAHYITKMMIGIDESFLDVDKKAEKERLKQLVTADTQYVENKGVNPKKFPYFGKVIMSSNDADRVMKLDFDEARFFVVKVPPLQKDQKDPDLEVKMKQEIPAFLHYVRHRKPHHPRRTRLWFRPEHFETEQYKVIVNETKSYMEKELEEFMKNLFILSGHREIRMDTRSMVEQINKHAKYKIADQELGRFLKNEMHLERQGPQRVRIPVLEQLEMSQQSKINEAPNGHDKFCRPFVFTIEQWLTPEEQKQAANTNDTKDGKPKNEDDGKLPF
jgi:hypothetical protein